VHVLLPVRLYRISECVVHQWSLECIWIMRDGNCTVQQSSANDWKCFSFWMWFGLYELGIVMLVHLLEWLCRHPVCHVQQWCMVDEWHMLCDHLWKSVTSASKRECWQLCVGIRVWNDLFSTMQQWIFRITIGNVRRHISAGHLDDWRHCLCHHSLCKSTDCDSKCSGEWMRIRKYSIGLFLLLHLQHWLFWHSLCIVQ
jgi:hypothetical protein